jgi:hypothetical protein
MKYPQIADVRTSPGSDMKRRPVEIAVASCLLLISSACERRNIEVPDRPTIRVVVTNADSVLIEYFRLVKELPDEETSVFIEHAMGSVVLDRYRRYRDFMELVSEYVTPAEVGLKVVMTRSQSLMHVMAWTVLEVGDNVRFGITDSVMRSLDMFKFSARARAETSGFSEVTEINIQHEYDLKVRKSRTRTLTLRVDEWNYFWWNRGYELPQRFEPALGDSLQNLLLASLRADMMLAIVIAVHPSARFDQFLRILDEVTLVDSMLGYDFLIGDNRASDYGNVTACLMLVAPEPGPYYVRSRVRQWTDADTRILARARQSAVPILNPSLSRENPASEVWFYAVDRYNVVGSLEPILDTSEVEYRTITIDGEEFPAEDQFVPVEELPELIFIPRAEYPDKTGIYREVVFIVARVLVDSKGDVRKAIVESETGPFGQFEEAARKVAMRSKWSPALQNGQPVAYWVSYKVEFKPEENTPDSGDSSSEITTEKSGD